MEGRGAWRGCGGGGREEKTRENVSEGGGRDIERRGGEHKTVDLERGEQCLAGGVGVRATFV